jgi:hypothetical protein
MSSANPATNTNYIESVRPAITNLDDTSYSFSNKTIILVLSLIIVLILLNPNIRVLLENLVRIVYNLTMRILTLLGVVTGAAVHVTANVGGDLARTGVDITEGTLHSVGQVLTGGNAPFAKDLGNLINAPATSNLDKLINGSTISQSHDGPIPDNTGNAIQNPIVGNKQTWCLVGEYKGTRGCIEIGNADKCMSGQVYPNQKLCLNPALTKNT